MVNSLAEPSGGKLAFHLRPDLIASRQSFDQRWFRLIKDPLTREFFRLEEEEYALARLLEDADSLEDAQAKFAEAFPGQTITIDELQSFARSLDAAGLLLRDVPGEGRRLHEKSLRQQRRERFAWTSNLLAIRIRGFDPDRLLSALVGPCGWIFSGWCFALWLLFCLAALLLVAVQFDQFQARLPSLHLFFTPANAGWLALTLGLTKILHELGHGLACKRLGGEVHELGVMFLCFAPCLYCDTSDSWTASSKRRAVVGAAGMYVELFLAAAATFLWWFSEPGLFHHLCFNVMFVCSVSTLLFNANPLLRYDGYYLLSDLMDVPNLRQKSQDAFRRTLAKWCLGLTPEADPFMPRSRRLFLIGYAITSTAYRWMVVFAIAWMLREMFAPHRLEIVATALAALALGGLAVGPWLRLFRFLADRKKVAQVSWIRASLSLAVFMIAGYWFVAAPTSHRVFAAASIEFADADRVYVRAAGQLERVLARPGDRVRAGQPLAVLSDWETRLEISRLSERLARESERFENLQRERFENPQAASRLPTLRKTLEDLRNRLRARKRDAERLTLAAPRSGVLFAPLARTPTASRSRALTRWTETPLTDRNVGALLESGALACLIGDPLKREALLLVDQSEIEFVKIGQPVRLRFDGAIGEPVVGRVAEISEVDMDSVPRSLSSKSGGSIATREDSSGGERPWSTVY
ncbi:MAG: hypothetical protein N2C14_05715, partial [Planctomycetales bacterium]